MNPETSVIHTMATGNQIRKYRNKLGWTLEYLSEKSGVDVGSISALEIRDSQKSKFFSKIAKAFGITSDQLENVSTDWLSTSNAAPPAQSFSPKTSPTNQPVAPDSTAKRAINSDELLNAIQLLDDALHDADPQNRSMVGMMLQSMANNPQNAQVVSAIEALLTPHGNFVESKKKQHRHT
jgi:transcriptional regulator with XRE-family HTH domain